MLGAAVGKAAGRVKWFDMKKGYGFIVPNIDCGIDGEVFVHQSNIISATGFRTLVDGLDVAFVCRPGKTGRNEAFEVTMTDGSPVRVQ
jgi:cold shock CspA family protein